MKTLILAAGRGRNLHPFTDTRPKSMIKISNKPTLHYLLELLIASNIQDYDIVIGHQGSRILDYFHYGQDLGIQINYLHQKEPMGIGNAVLLAKDKFMSDDHFMLVYGDIFVQQNIFKNVIGAFNYLQKPVAAVCLTQTPSLFGNVYMTPDMAITRIVEKPERSLGNYVLAGVFILPTSFFDILKVENGSMEQAFSHLVRETGLCASIWEDDWTDLGYPWDILKANQIWMSNLQETRIHKSVQFTGNVQIEGPVWIDEGVRIESGTVIKGPCYVGPNCYIGNNVLLRQNASIGEGSMIGFGVEIKNSVLFGYNKVGRLSFVGDSVIGENAVIGSGVMTVNSALDHTPICVTLNDKKISSHLEKLGAFIGDNVEVGASNTLEFGTIIPPNIKIKGNFSIAV